MEKGTIAQEKGQLEQIFHGQRKFFNSGATMDYEFRKRQLKKLMAVIRENEERLTKALYADLRKPALEAFGSEIGFVYKEIKYALKHLRSWMADERVPTDLAHFPSKSWIQYRPKGIVLILAPWNYPFNLVFTPVIGAIAAGNCCIIKPSEEAKHTANVVEEIISNNFDPGFMSVVQMPGREVIPRLIEPFHFDHIFFTGSERAGWLVYQAAAKQMSPVTLELGGKSPALVLPDADYNMSAKRIVWGKNLNSGQTCVAPDFAIVPKKDMGRMLDLKKKHVRSFHGDDPLNSGQLTSIINEKHFDRLVAMLEDVEVVQGGCHDRERLLIEPTIVKGHLDHPIMKEEVFGPILPVIGYENDDEVLEIIRRNPNPLAFYLFTKSRKNEEKWLNAFRFGGGGVNTALIHVASTSLPFGGVGSSGFGRYHGKYSFELFSVSQGISKTSSWPDVPLRYPPYTDWKTKIARWFFG